MSAPQNRPIFVPFSPRVGRAPLPKCEPDLRDIQGPPRPFFGDVVTLAIVLRAITFLHLGFQPKKNDGGAHVRSLSRAPLTSSVD